MARSRDPNATSVLASGVAFVLRCAVRVREQVSYAGRMTQPQWQELAPGVLVRAHPELDLNCGLVVGERRALVIDTHLSARAGSELFAAVREVTDREIVVVNTHAHFDHCFGNIAFRDSQIYAHVGAVEAMLDAGKSQRTDAVALLAAQEIGELADDVADTEIVLPFYLIEDDTVLDLGGRVVHLLYGGRAHTDHDLVVAVPDAGVVFWGDLIEQDGDVSTGGAYLQEWPVTLRSLAAREAVRDSHIQVPGHGSPEGADFIEGQARRIEQMSDSAAAPT
ncbi:MBL fold metallo-hydrolase [soil metagenome]